MKKIKFSEDYEKLPKVWGGTLATLIAVYPVSVEMLEKNYPAFVYKDTKIRGEDRHYPLNFKDALVLVFLHQETGMLINTIRGNYREKFNYYVNSIGDDFELTDMRK